MEHVSFGSFLIAPSVNIEVRTHFEQNFEAESNFLSLKLCSFISNTNMLTRKSWISPVSNRTYLNILDMMNSPGKGDSSGYTSVKVTPYF